MFSRANGREVAVGPKCSFSWTADAPVLRVNQDVRREEGPDLQLQRPEKSRE
jgi:hypothetical protein